MGPKDTIQVPVNGYVIYRTKLDNAGTWLIHCHIDFHFLAGMGMVMQIGDLRSRPGQKWNAGPLKRNRECPLKNHQEIIWYFGMNPKTCRCVKPGTDVYFMWNDKHHNVNQRTDLDDCYNLPYTNTNPEYGPFKFSSLEIGKEFYF